MSKDITDISKLLLSEDIIDISKISKMNQITLPKAVREILDINENDRVLFVKYNGKVVIKKL